MCDNRFANMFAKYIFVLLCVRNVRFVDRNVRLVDCNVRLIDRNVRPVDRNVRLVDRTDLLTGPFFRLFLVRTVIFQIFPIQNCPFSYCFPELSFFRVSFSELPLSLLFRIVISQVRFLPRIALFRFFIFGIVKFPIFLSK